MYVRKRKGGREGRRKGGREGGRSERCYNVCSRITAMRSMYSVSPARVWLVPPITGSSVTSGGGGHVLMGAVGSLLGVVEGGAEVVEGGAAVDGGL